LAGWLERGGGVGAVHGRLAIDFYHRYKSGIKLDITGHNLDNIVGYKERDIEIIEWISIQ
jgi:hypothetical protein